MSTYSKQLVINKFILPKELMDIIKDYTFHTIKKIQKNDKRYDMVLSIPRKEYDPTDEVTFVYMYITEKKDYFLTYTNFEIQLQTFLYIDNVIHSIEGYSTTI